MKVDPEPTLNAEHIMQEARQMECENLVTDGNQDQKFRIEESRISRNDREQGRITSVVEFELEIC